MPAEYIDAQDRLRQAAVDFCESFVKGTPPHEILSSFFVSPVHSSPRITEHGPKWAMSKLPFLHATFVGRGDMNNTNTTEAGTTCDDYFSILSSILSYSEMSFPDPLGFIVDPHFVPPNGRGDGVGAVSVVGQATFKSVETGISWREEFIYRLSEFDRHGKMGHWEIWADPLSAWEAVSGRSRGENTED